MSLQKLDDVTALIKAHLVEEFQAGFPRLSRAPSTGTIKFLEHFSTLATADQDLLLNTLARVSALRFFSPLAVRDQMLELANTDPDLLRYRAAMHSAPFGMGLRYQGLRTVKSMLADRMSVEMMAQPRASLDFTPRKIRRPA
jgi:hypothetical protein